MITWNCNSINNFSNYKTIIHNTFTKAIKLLVCVVQYMANSSALCCTFTPLVTSIQLARLYMYSILKLEVQYIAAVYSFNECFE